MPNAWKKSTLQQLKMLLIGDDFDHVVSRYVMLDRELEIACYLHDKLCSGSLSPEEDFAWGYLTTDQEYADGENRYKRFRAKFAFSDKTDGERISNVMQRYALIKSCSRKTHKSSRSPLIDEMAYIVDDESSTAGVFFWHLKHQLPGLLTQVLNQSAAIATAESVISDAARFMAVVGYPPEIIRDICSQALTERIKSALRVLD